MDSLSAAASIVAVLQLIDKVIRYLNNIKNVPKECEQCMIEISNLQSLLISLYYHLQQGQAGDSWFTAVQTLNNENNSLNYFKQTLKQLLSRVEIYNNAQVIKRQLL